MVHAYCVLCAYNLVKIVQKYTGVDSIMLSLKCCLCEVIMTA